MKDETHSYQAKMETRVAVRDDRLRSVTVLATQSQFSIGLLVPFPRRPTLVERHVITLRPCAEICNQSSAISKVLPADLAKKTALNFSGCLPRLREVSAPVTIRSVKEICGDSATNPALSDSRRHGDSGVVARAQRMSRVSRVVIGS